jgi:hypothetical protein
MNVRPSPAAGFWQTTAKYGQAVIPMAWLSVELVLVGAAAWR